MSAGSGSPPLPRLPAASLPGVVAPMSQGTAAPRNPMFDALVKSENDTAGLLAYGLYKLARRDWADAFLARHRREPRSEDIDAFILGEQTPSRIAGYRQQAEARLAALAPPAVPAAATPPRPGSEMAEQPKPRLKDLMIRLALLLVAVVAVGLMIRFLIVRP